MKKQKAVPAQGPNTEEPVVHTKPQKDIHSEEDSEKRRILRARAALLASETAGADKITETYEFTEFVIANERYGVENVYIREVYPLKDFTSLPGVPSHVFGILNVRGKILSVIDLRRFFDLPDKGLSGYSKVIIIHCSTMEFGILADQITGVCRYPAQELMAALPTLTDVRSDYLKGVTKDRLVLLDGEKLLNDRRIIVHEAY